MAGVAVFIIVDVRKPARLHEMIQALLLGRLGNPREAGEFRMMVAAEPLGNVARPRGCCVSQLSMELEVPF